MKTNKQDTATLKPGGRSSVSRAPWRPARDRCSSSNRCDHGPPAHEDRPAGVSGAATEAAPGTPKSDAGRFRPERFEGMWRSPPGLLACQSVLEQDPQGIDTPVCGRGARDGRSGVIAVPPRRLRAHESDPNVFVAQLHPGCEWARKPTHLALRLQRRSRHRHMPRPTQVTRISPKPELKAA